MYRHLSTVMCVFEYISPSALLLVELTHGVIPKKLHNVAVVALKVKKDSNISQNAQLAAAAGSVH